MKQEITQNEFTDAIELEAANKFSYEARVSLYNHLTQQMWERDRTELSKDDLDAEKICSEYTEFKTLEDAQKVYNVDSIDELCGSTIVLSTDTTFTFIVKDF